MSAKQKKKKKVRHPYRHRSYAANSEVKTTLKENVKNMLKCDGQNSVKCKRKSLLIYDEENKLP